MSLFFMDKQEAIKAMKEGKKVTHRYFDGTEYVTSDPTGRQYTLEDGSKLSASEFWRFRDGQAWEDGYSIWGINKTV